jgi:hydroxymethylglutaryl-CoA reductase
MDTYKGFYKKTTEQRRSILSNEKDLDFNTILNEETASHMIENYVSNFELPMGVAPLFLIDQKTYHIPMVTEESSVIAAASKAAKIVADNNGFFTTIHNTLKQGEIAYHKPNNPTSLKNYVLDNKDVLFELANTSYPSIVKRGGGIRDIKVRETDNFVIIDVYMDTQEAMGANMLNTVLEALAQHISQQTHEIHLFAILSNLTTKCLVSATCTIQSLPLATLKNIEIASLLAQEDIYRATTHNKGIMNGIEAITLASGNDTRAVSAAAHAYASITGSYQPLATWKLIDHSLVGTITLPLALGSVGGAIALHPKAQLTQKILNLQSAQELMGIIASVGLAQNFAALLALTTDGIQKGHMSLHASNLALSVKTPPELLEQVVKELQETKPMNQDSAKAILNRLLSK